MTDVLVPASRRLAGVITTAELAGAGKSAAQIRTLVRRGLLVPLVRGVYAPAAAAAAEKARGQAGEHALRVAAALALFGPGTAASHRSAAVVHGLGLLGAVSSQPVHVTRPPGGTATRKGRPGVHVHAASLPPGHAAVRDGIPVTSAARTVVDLARTASLREGVAVADSALRSRQTSKDELAAVLAACARWRGIERARRAVAFSDPRPESVLESISRVAFAEHGLPPPDLQAWVGDDEEMIGRVDFLWRAHRTIAEADGALKYADPSRALTQLQRDASLRAAGFEVVHFTWHEIVHAPGRVVAAIRAAFLRSSGWKRLA